MIIIHNQLLIRPSTNTFSFFLSLYYNLLTMKINYIMLTSFLKSARCIALLGGVIFFSGFSTFPYSYTNF